MNIKRLYEILAETTRQLRKGEVLEGSPNLVEQAKRGAELTGGGVLEVYAMPHESEVAAGIEKIDLEFLMIGVDRTLAELRREELISILNEYPHPDRLAAGPSYIELGAEIGDQGAAFQLFALGKVLGLWDVVTPSRLGITGEDARKMAGAGYIMITGYRSRAFKISVGGTHGVREESGFASLELARTWLLDRPDLTSDSDNTIWCKDTAGNAWRLIQNDGALSWKAEDRTV